MAYKSTYDPSSPVEVRKRKKAALKAALRRPKLEAVKAARKATDRTRAVGK